MLVITIAKIYLTADFLSDLNLDIHSVQYKIVAVINIFIAYNCIFGVCNLFNCASKKKERTDFYI